MRSLYVCLFACVFSSFVANSQCNDPDTYCMNSGLVYACQGSLYDAGGDGVYPAESAVTTICSETDGFKVSITFNSFDLYGGPNIPDSDQLIIYDGTSESAPLLGIYSANDLNGVTISASNGNASGCLMIQFISGGFENTLYEGWQADVFCSQPCIQPQAEASVVDASLESEIFLSCLDDEVTLSAAGSSAAPGQTIVNYVWDMKDGNLVTAQTENTTYQFTNPAIYDVTLTVIDDLGCAGETMIHVGMMGSPSLDIPDNVSMCLGTEFSLEAAFTPCVIDNSPQMNNNIALFIPDDQTQSFQTEIMVTGYQAGATMNSCDDLMEVYVNMEHSFMGDLVIELICPSGQNVTLHQQGGGGTYLGEPVDTEWTDQGIGYDYSWSDESVLGTWADNTDAGGTLAEGVYQPVEPLCELIGCPLNGLWALNVYDLWGADNGYVFSWGLGLSVGNNAEALQYQSTINDDAAGSFWSGSDILSIDENADVIAVNSTEYGALDLFYNTVDNLGCTYSELADISVIDNPIQVLMNDVFVYDQQNTTLCGNATLDNTLLNWTWTPADGLANPNSFCTEVLIPNDNTAYTVTASSDFYLGCSDSQTINMVLPEFVVSGHIFYDENQNGIFDTDELPVGNFPFTNNSAITAFSDADGYYSAFTTYGNNTVSISADPSLWIVTTPSSYTTVLNDGTTESLNNDFGIYPASNENIILNGSVSNSNTWCVFDNVQTISVSNDGNTIESGYLIYTYDPSCTVIETNPAPFNVVDNQLYFAFDQLFFSSTALFYVTLDMPDSPNPGDVFSFTTETFYYEGEVSVPIQTDGLLTTMQCSYDPNDKREMNGQGNLGIIAPNTTLDYVIRFQNTGTAPAMDVVITDQLSSLLNYATMDPVASSHVYTASVTSNGLVTFHFDNILLPDSGANFEESIGFIHFRIQQMQDLPIGTVINNEAAIYFDANAPVITNTTINTILECTGQVLSTTMSDNEITVLDLVSDVNWYLDGQLLPSIGYVFEATNPGTYYATATLENGCPARSEDFIVTSVQLFEVDVMDVYPNPATDFVNLALKGGMHSITIFNQFGQEVVNMSDINSNFQLDVSALARGTYTLRVSNDQSVQHKIIVLE